MRRVAASRVYFIDSEKRDVKNEYSNHVVELFDHAVVNHYSIEGELPMTEWLGGTIIIREREAYHIRQVLSPAELSTYDSGGDSYIERL